MSKLDNKNKNIAAVIVSYNGGALMYNNVCQHRLYLNALFVIDNGSSDAETQFYLNKIEYDNIAKVIRLRDNYGIAYALNRGVEIALQLGKEWIITFDQDSTPINDIPSIMMQYVDKQYSLGIDVSIVSPRIIEREDDHIENCQQKNDILQYSITSGNLVKTSVFKNIGLYKEEYFIDSVDFDFCLRAKRFGYKIYKSYEALLLHRLGSNQSINIARITFDIVIHSPLRRYYMVRNHFKLMRMYWNIAPLFFIKKTTFLFLMILQIILLENNKYDQMKMISKGIIDFIKNKSGRIDGFP